MAECEVITTRAGARAIMDVHTGEVMHPIGPIHEAQHMYVAPSRLAERLHEDDASPLVVFDIGLGAASNAITAWRVADALGTGRRLDILSIDHSLEPLALALEHASDFALEGRAGDAARALLEHHAYTDARTRWRFLLQDLVVALKGPLDVRADIVFWDVYSARLCPALWTPELFSAVRSSCRDGATLHTYSGSFPARAAMLLGGFAVGLGPSPGAKQRHSTIAATAVDVLDRPLDRAWLERLRGAAASLPVTFPADALDRIASAPQFA